MTKEDEEHSGPWWVGNCRCRLCDSTWVGVVPVDDEEDDVLTRMECPNCGNMTGEKE